MKDTIARTKQIASTLPALVMDFIKNSIIGFFFETKSLTDAFIYTKYWALIWGTLVKFGIKLCFKKGPMGVVGMFRQYPWLFHTFRTTKLLRRLTRGRKGAYLDATGLVIHGVALTLVDTLEDITYHPELVLVALDMTPFNITNAMGLKNWCVETLGLALPLIHSDASTDFIDEAENNGMNPDSCNFVKAAIGMIAKNQQPRGCAIVTANLPCDTSVAAYTYIQKKYDVPTYRLQVPYNFKSERAEKLLSEDLKEMIEFLEKHTPGRMDWEKLKKECEARNYMMELEFELWDMMRAKPAPMAGEAIWLAHLWLFILYPGHKVSIRVYERLVELAKKNLKAKKAAVENEKYRAVVWNPVFPQFPDIINIMERTRGITLIMDSLSYNHNEFIDTSTPETMIKGLSKIVLDGPMIRHTRGPAENYLDDIFRCYKQFDLDMVWIANHLSCKSAQAIHGVLREKCREMKIPLLILDYVLLDPRIVSPESMIKQVDVFMETVMKDKQPQPAVQ